MTAKDDYTGEEWATLVRSPLVAGMAITFADPGGPIEIVKETSAVLKVVSETAADRQDVVGALAREVRAMAEKRQNPVGDFKPKGTMATKEILDELGRANGIVTAKAAPEEAQAYREWLLECAQRAAEAAKEGGFLGFHAVRVSEGEQKMLDELRRALGPDGG